MLKHAAKTTLELERFPPEKRVSIATVAFRRRSSTFNTALSKLSLRRSNSLSWPNSCSSGENQVIYSNCYLEVPRETNLIQKKEIFYLKENISMNTKFTAVT